MDHKKDPTDHFIHNPLLMAIITILILVLSIYFFSRHQRAKTSSDNIQCQNNCRELAGALENYCVDHNGKYPARLSELTGTYIKKIPKCPSAKKDTYSESYQVSSDFQIYTMYCMGLNHPGIGIKANYPRYSSINGLIVND